MGIQVHYTLAQTECYFRWTNIMKNTISAGLITGVLSLAGIGILAHGLYTGRLTNALASASKTIVAQVECTEPQLTSIQFNAEIVKFLVFNDRLHLLMPLPITGSSATIVDIRAAMKKVRK